MVGRNKRRNARPLASGEKKIIIKAKAGRREAGYGPSKPIGTIGSG